MRVDLPKRIKTLSMQKKILEIFNDHASYREQLRPFPNSPSAGTLDVTWIAKLDESEKMAFRLYENLIYGADNDPQLRFAVRQGKTALDLCTTDGPIKDLFDSIDTVAHAEATAKLGIEHPSAPQLTGGEPTVIVPSTIESAETDDSNQNGSMPTSINLNKGDQWQNYAMMRIMETTNFIDDNDQSESALAS